MYIRKSTMEDLPEILELYRQARKFMRDHGNAGQWGDSYPEPEIVIRDIREGNSYLCVERVKETGAERPLAVFFYSGQADPDYDRIDDGEWMNDAPYGVVHRIASGFGGRRGAASFCIAWAFEQCGNLRMDTHRDNIPMQKLLKKSGFVRCGQIYIRDGSPRIAFQKIPVQDLS